jgi:hypothetical protein
MFRRHSLQMVFRVPGCLAVTASSRLVLLMLRSQASRRGKAGRDLSKRRTDGWVVARMPGRTARAAHEGGDVLGQARAPPPNVAAWRRGHAQHSTDPPPSPIFGLLLLPVTQASRILRPPAPLPSRTPPLLLATAPSSSPAVETRRTRRPW